MNYYAEDNSKTAKTEPPKVPEKRVISEYSDEDPAMKGAADKILSMVEEKTTGLDKAIEKKFAKDIANAKEAWGEGTFQPVGKELKQLKKDQKSAEWNRLYASVAIGLVAGLALGAMPFVLLGGLTTAGTTIAGVAIGGEILSGLATITAGAIAIGSAALGYSARKQIGTLLIPDPKPGEPTLKNVVTEESREEARDKLIGEYASEIAKNFGKFLNTGVSGEDAQAKREAVLNYLRALLST